MPIHTDRTHIVKCVKREGRAGWLAGINISLSRCLLLHTDKECADGYMGKTFSYYHSNLLTCHMQNTVDSNSEIRMGEVAAQVRLIEWTVSVQTEPSAFRPF